MNKRLKMKLVSIGVALSAVLTLGLSGSASAVVDNSPDCDNVAIIRCGAFTMKAMREKAAQGDVPRVFNAFGISQGELDGKFVNGVVWRDGRVTVDGKVVATDAMTAGRNFGGTPIPNTNGAGKYPTSKFVTEGQTAFVKMIDGKFKFAIIKACGNPVSATPKEKKVVTPEEEPASECLMLTVDKISRTTQRFAVKATATGGAKIVKYEFGFGDGQGVTTIEPTYTYDYKTPGTYTATVKIHVDAKGVIKAKTSAACSIQVVIPDEQMQVCELATKRVITINKAQYDTSRHTLNMNYCTVTPVVVKNISVCELATDNMITIDERKFDSNLHSKNPEDCKEQPQVIAATGPAAAFAGILGTSSLGYGAYTYLSSRRHLISKFLGR